MPRTMTMMGGPIDARKSPTAVNNLADEQEPQLVREQRHLPRAAELPRRRSPRLPGLPAAHRLRGDEPRPPPAVSHYDYFRDLIRGDDDSAEAHRQFYDEYNAVLDMPAEYYLDTIKTVFQDFALVNGTWIVHGELVRPQDITGTALLTIEGELDDISGAGQTRPRTTCAPASRRRASSTTTWKARATTASSRAAAGARRSTRR